MQKKKAQTQQPGLWANWHLQYLDMEQAGIEILELPEDQALATWQRLLADANVPIAALFDGQGSLVGRKDQSVAQQKHA